MAKQSSKRKRLRGSRTNGWGSRKKHKGKGMKGGKGMAGTGKKAGQKVIFVRKYFPEGYFGKKGFISRGVGKRLKTINLENIKGKNGEANLEGYKVLGKGELREKLNVKADAFSESAKEKIEKAGGKAILLSESEETKEEK